MRKKILAVVMAAMLAGSTMGAEILAGGSIPLINNLLGIGVLSLDFSSPGTDVEIALLIVNNNSTSFDVTLDFANNAEFQNAAAVPIAMTGLNLRPGGLGVLGTGIVPFLAGGTDILAAAQTGTYTWNPADQTTATVNYSISMRASWALFTGLAGLYTESVTATITATL